MSELETRLRELLQDTTPPPSTSLTPPDELVTGARRYATRARRGRVAVIAAALVAVVGLGGVVASVAGRDRTLSPAEPRPPVVRTPTLPAGPAWSKTASVAGRAGKTFTLDLHTVISPSPSTSPDPRDANKRDVTGPGLSGYYTLTNTSTTAVDIAAPVTVFAYWKVPVGFCDRYDHSVSMVGLAVPRVNGGELCPMAMGDSTLPGIPQTMRPGIPLLVRIEPQTIGLGQNYPLVLSKADAALAVRTTSAPPAGWAAFDQDLSTTANTPIASNGVPLP